MSIYLHTCPLGGPVHQLVYLHVDTHLRICMHVQAYVDIRIYLEWLRARKMGSSKTYVRCWRCGLRKIYLAPALPYSRVRQTNIPRPQLPLPKLGIVVFADLRYESLYAVARVIRLGTETVCNHISYGTRPRPRAGYQATACICLNTYL